MEMHLEFLSVNSDRLWAALMDMGKIGETSRGGAPRLTLTEDDRRARDLFVRWAREVGCTITVDQMGNIFARRAGIHEDLPPVMIGSHLDTVPTGGKFDGPYGVLAGLEVFRTLNDAGVRTVAPLELVNWTNEEGSRFSPATFGSLVFCGLMDLQFAMTRTDKDGVTFADALAAIGYDGEEKIGDHIVGPYFEVHVEQGPVLEKGGEKIGIVTGCYAARYYVVTVTGMAAHVGPTPMGDRKDALVGAARVVLEVNRVGTAHGPEGRSNAPHIEVFPNVRGVIPGVARVSCDLRHVDQNSVERMETDLRSGLSRLERELRMEISVECYFEFGPISFDLEMTELCRQTTATLAHAHRDMLAIAGHDAIALNNVTPTALIFIPSRNGLSHNETEYSDPESVTAGANVLLHAVLAKAGITATSI